MIRDILLEIKDKKFLDEDYTGYSDEDAAREHSLMSFVGVDNVTKEEKDFILQEVMNTKHHSDILYLLTDFLYSYRKEGNNIDEILLISSNHQAWDGLKSELLYTGSFIHSSNFFPQDIPLSDLSNLIDNIDINIIPSKEELDFLLFLYDSSEERNVKNKIIQIIIPYIDILCSLETFYEDIKEEIAK